MDIYFNDSKQANYSRNCIFCIKVARLFYVTQPPSEIFSCPKLMSQIKEPWHPYQNMKKWIIFEFYSLTLLVRFFWTSGKRRTPCIKGFLCFKVGT